MIGDNPVADGAGARALGIPAVVIRGDASEPEEGLVLRAGDAVGAVAMLQRSCATRRT